MVSISIVCLIYKSCKLADWVYESVYEYTPMLQNGKAEFFFVANDPTEELLCHLSNKQYPYIVNKNPVYSDAEMFEQGFGMPEYMGRVYRGYNQGILYAKGERVVLINSDNYFSEDWLENLCKYSEYKNIVTSTLVEPGHPKFGVFPGAIRADFGRTSENFNKEDFHSFVKRTKVTGIKSGGAYMPCMFYKNVGIYAGLYPEGNIAGDSFENVVQYGDENFYEKLSKFGISHITSLDSIAYHLKEGEREDVSLATVSKKNEHTVHPCEPYKKIPKVAFGDLCTYLMSSYRHSTILKQLKLKFTVALFVYDDKTFLNQTIQSVLCQTFNNIQIIAFNCGNNKEVDEILLSYGERILYYHFPFACETDLIKYELSSRLTGEYLMLLHSGSIYSPDVIEKQVERLLQHDSNAILFSSYSAVDENLENICTFDSSNAAKMIQNENVTVSINLAPNTDALFSNAFIFPKSIINKQIVVDNNNFTFKLKDYKLIYCSEVVVSHIDHNRMIRNILKETLYKYGIDSEKELLKNTIQAYENSIALKETLYKYGLECESELLKSTIQAYENSTSWKLTKPFRKIMSRLKRR